MEKNNNSNSHFSYKEIVKKLKSLQIIDDQNDEVNRATKFPESVETLKELKDQPESYNQVIESQKIKVNNEAISHKSCECLEAFSFNDFNEFHELEVFAKLKLDLKLFNQEPDEGVFDYGLRATRRRDKSIEELAMFYEIKVASKESLKKVDDLMIKFFIMGLIPSVRSYIKSQPTSLQSAIEIAIKGEAWTSDVRQPLNSKKKSIKAVPERSVIQKHAQKEEVRETSHTRDFNVEGAMPKYSKKFGKGENSTI